MVGVAATVATLVAAVPAFAVTIGSTGSNTFDQASYSTGEGVLSQFQWSGGGPHNVTANQNGPDGKRLFRSATISSGTTPIDGTQYLPQGSYGFTCTVHPDTMQANLVVSASGTPVARPDIEVKILSRDLDKVQNKDKLAVKIRAVTESEDASLVARLGKRFLGRKAGIDLAAGQVRKLRLKIGKKGRAALEDRNKAKVKLKGTVPFGSPDAFKRVLK
jgi:plastocyanin